MIENNEFTTPRNIFEKLIRDSERTEKSFNGDSILNFVSTAYLLEKWIKHNPLSKTEVVKRLLKRISKDKNFKLCKEIVSGTRLFSTKLDTVKKQRLVVFDDGEIDGMSFKNELLELYSLYFKIK